MIYIGIDPGKSGGIAAIDDDGFLMHLSTMPLSGGPIDPVAVANILRKLDKKHVFIEHAQAMPKQGVTSMFNYGMGFGVLQGICSALGCPMTLIKPRLWQKAMHVGADQSACPKDRSFQVVYRLFPTANLKASERCKNDHDGMADALLIAEYGRRLLVNPRL